ncbi:MAG: lipopolysaccharide export system permease protein [Candidatus Cloacimonadota bacterium]|jgi:lipopolysaccharide export system permease protein|nr:lipopolysaccharide export system permease protein [Candidatus Cloacimonadota bacterium]
MRILDRYILKEYIKTFLIIIIAFSVIFLVVDIFDRLPRLLSKSAAASDIAIYFLLRIPYLFVLTSPVVVLLSGLFLMNTLSKYNESIAIRSAGISIVRMVTPLFWFGLIFSFFIMGVGEFVLPEAEAYRDYIYKVKIKGQKIEDKKMRSNIYYVGKDNSLYYIGFFDGYRNLLKTIDITSFDPENGEMTRKISATSAKWENGNWHFVNCYIRDFVDGKLSLSQFYETKVIQQVDVEPIDFVKSAKDPMAMNFFELKDYIERLKKVGEKYSKELVELYHKVTFPFANFIILFFSIPLVSTSARGKGRGIIFAIGLLVCFLYLSTLRIFQSMGYNEVFSPLTAALAPHIIFATAGLFFVIKAEI